MRIECNGQKGSVLMVAMLTIAILSILCATSLYVASQNANATTQATSWEQAMTGAEGAIDQAMNALNTNSWTGWYNVSAGSLPSSQPSFSGVPNATSIPGSGKYNYLGPSTNPGSTALYTPIVLAGEASNSITWWVTVDNGSVGPISGGLISGGLQAYRIRAVGIVAAPGPARVSNNKMDNDLRMVSLQYDRLAGGAVGNPKVMRRIELVATPVVASGSGTGITMATGISMSGGAYVDSFNSNSGARAWGVAYRDATNPQLVGLLNNTSNSDLRNTYIYGGLTYSGTTVKNTTNVEGGIVTPYPYGSITPAATPPPAGAGVTYTTYSSAGSDPPNSGIFNAGTANSPAYIKVNGDLTVSSSGKILHVVQANNSPSNNVIYVWVTGKLTIQGSGYINQDSNVKATWYVGGDITFSGNAYLNGNPGGPADGVPYSAPGYAGNLTIYGMGTSNKFTDSGSALFTGVVIAPKYDATISGSGDYTGAITGNTLTLSGSGNFHYDESLNPNSGSGNSKFAFSRWFEDNSDPKRGITY